VRAVWKTKLLKTDQNRTFTGIMTFLSPTQQHRSTGKMTTPHNNIYF